MKYEHQGARLREIREAAERTLDEAGKYVGVSGPAIRHYESGRTRPDPETARALDDLYGSAGEIAGLYGFTQPGGPSLADVAAKLDELLALVHGMGAALRRLVDDELGPEPPAPPRSQPDRRASRQSSDPTGPLPRP